MLGTSPGLDLKAKPQVNHEDLASDTERRGAGAAAESPSLRGRRRVVACVHRTIPASEMGPRRIREVRGFPLSLKVAFWGKHGEAKLSYHILGESLHVLELAPKWSRCLHVACTLLAEAHTERSQATSWGMIQ